MGAFTEIDMQLPEEFTQNMKQLLNEEQWSLFTKGMQENPPVSVRINPKKSTRIPGFMEEVATLEPVPWSTYGYYLDKRPNFTFDPLLHAGAYYVQEASSMFVEHVIKELITKSVCMLDLCAAPGGKSIASRSVLHEGSLLVSNEPIRTRAQVLMENIQKWGHPNCMVTSSYPADYSRSGAMFDVVLCDVPCSGEGMFRKDPVAISEWNGQKVEKCWHLQREIVLDAWKCLLPGGILIYSTCTFNTKENEENIRFFIDELQAIPVAIPTIPEWSITGSLLKGFEEPVYRFIPGISRGEGLFMCVLKKKGEPKTNDCRSLRKMIHENTHLLFCSDSISYKNDGDNKLNKSSKRQNSKTKTKEKAVDNTPPNHAEALAETLEKGKYPQVELSYTDAMKYLRREAITLPPDTPRGIIVVCFKQLPLGFVKNIGNRANNLYPQNWKIKSTHIPTEYETIFRPA